MNMNAFYDKVSHSEVIMKDIKDPVPELINRLQYCDDINVKIRREFDNPRRSKKRSEIIRIHSGKETSNLEKKKIQENTQPNLEEKISEKLKDISAHVVTTSQGNFIVSNTHEYDFQDKKETIFNQHKYELRKPILLFFMKKQNALMYLHEVVSKEPEEIGKLKITEVSLETVYKLNRNTKSKMDSRLISDLTEMKFVMDNRGTEDKFSVHPKQRYEHNYFQGIPVYILRYAKDNATKTLVTNTENTSTLKKLIFFKWEDASEYWKEWCHKNGKKNIKPNIELYNLESLLIELELSNEKELTKYTFVPVSKEIKNVSYQDPKELLELYEYSKFDRVIRIVESKAPTISRIVRRCTGYVTRIFHR